MKLAEAPPGGAPAASWPALASIALARFALNLPARVFYPFLPAIGRALGVPLTTASLLLTVRAAASALSPLYGVLADRWGRRPLMLAGGWRC